MFVGNLSFDTTSDTLRSLFETYGPVSDCYMPRDRDTDRPRGFAFVTMAAADAEASLSKLDGELVDGRNIKVNEAMGRERGGGGRGGGGYGGRGGGGYGGGYGGGGGGGYGGGRGYGRGEFFGTCGYDSNFMIFNFYYFSK